MLIRPKQIVLPMLLTIPTCVIAADAPAVFGQILGTIMNGASQQSQQQQPAPERRSTQQVTPSSPKPAARTVVAPPLKNAYNSKTVVQRIQIQTNLKQAGHYNSTLDGLWGENTQKAIESYANATQTTDLLASFAGANTLLANILREQSGAQASGHSSGQASGQSTPPSTGPVVAVAAVTGTPATTSQSASNERDELKARYNAMRDQLALLQEVLKHQQSQAQSPASGAKISALQAKIGVYVTQTDAMSNQYESRYSTPIRPTNANLGITAAKAAEIFPKIPYYIPGTEETGEMLVVPTVTDTGELKYDFSFLDPGAEFGTVRESIMLAPKDIELAIDGFDKVSEWSDKAHEQGIRRRFDKRATCFPVENCKEKKTGISSTEVDFLIYEDGSTAARVQRNKGTFSSGYNFSIESSLLLASYLEYMRDIGQKEFSVGSMTESDMHDMFK